MPIDASIPLKAVAPNPLNSLGSMLQIQQAQLNLQKSRDTYDADVAQRQAESSQTQQLVDPNVRTATANAGTVETAQKSAAFNLDKSQWQRVQDDFNSISNDPAVVKAADPNTDPAELPALGAQIQSTLKQHAAFARGVGVPDPVIGKALGQFAEVAQTNPQQFQQFVIQRQKAAVGASGQIGASNPQGVQVSNNLQTGVVSTNQYGSHPVGSTIPGTVQTQFVPLAQQQQTGADAMGNPTVTAKDARGNVTSVSGAPVQGAPGSAPSKTPPFVMPAGETPDTLKVVQGMRVAANAAAASAPAEHFTNQQIVRLANETSTGKGAEILTGLGGQFAGIPWSSNMADNYNRLGHFIAMQNVQKAQNAGLAGSDAARSLAAESTASTAWTKDAIISATKVNDALTTGSQMFNTGLEKAVAAGGPFAARAFQNQWAKVADVNAMRLYNAKKSGDTTEYNTIVQQAGGVKSTQFQNLLFKADRMSELIHSGGASNGQ